MKRYLLSSIFIVGMSWGQSMLAKNELKKVTFRPQWVPQAQFAGYYVAAKNGFYKDAGLDVQILSGGPAIHGLVDVAAKKTTFCTDLFMSGLVMASKGAPIVNIAQTHQTTGLMLISYKKDGIDKPEKMNGKKVGVWPGLFEIPPSVFARKYGAKVTNIQQGFTMDLFLEKKLDLASAMIYNEYHVVLDAGVKQSDLNEFKYQDFGLNFPDDGVYAHPETCTNDPQLCKSFIEASIKGWLWAFDNHEKATEIVMEAANSAKTNTTYKHQLRMLKETEKLILYKKGREGIGQLSKEDFDFVLGELIKTGKITESGKSKLTYESYYKPALSRK
ncbi:MAG: ABC transporter substrate-binding protein [Oligoflexales bacterium]|nr:ABC transporter substrate-binding protein [Oligoflexales bacterium]